MNNLQKSLFLNAVFSGISGIILVVFSASFAYYFGLTNNLVFFIVGIALIIFSATIVYEIRKQRPLGVLWIILQDFLWVIASTVILLLNPFGLSSFGNWAIFIVAVIVLFMAINQSRALALLDASEVQPSLKVLRFERVVHAPKVAVWKVISDVENYHKVAPNIDSVKIVSGKAEGMVRSCSHGKDSWTETCTLWQEEKKYSFTVDTNHPKYPYPFASLKGTWEVEYLSDDTTNVILLFEFQYKYAILNVVAHPFLKGKFAQIVDELFNNWESIIKSRNF